MTILTRVAAWVAAVMMAMCAVEPAAAANTAIAQPTSILDVPALAAGDAVPVTPTGPSLNDRVISFVDFGNQSDEEQCLAKAVFYEARGESLEGQLAVAQVILNRAKSGHYPPTICGVVTQPAQFSFVHDGRLPDVDHHDGCWHKALAIAEVALKNQGAALPADVFWYHATYVDPRWNRSMTRTVQIGSHIFYS